MDRLNSSTTEGEIATPSTIIIPLPSPDSTEHDRVFQSIWRSTVAVVVFKSKAVDKNVDLEDELAAGRLALMLHYRLFGQVTAPLNKAEDINFYDKFDLFGFTLLDR